MKKYCRIFYGALLTLALAPAHAAWPERPITLVIPFPPGGGTDVIGRIIGKELGDSLGVNVVVENKSGAGGNIGTRYVTGAKPDGYTLLMGTTAQTISAALYKAPGYDLLKQLDAIVLLGKFNYGWQKHGEYDYFYDIWSNIHYGYVGVALGFSAAEMINGAGLAQALDDY